MPQDTTKTEKKENKKDEEKKDGDLKEELVSFVLAEVFFLLSGNGGENFSPGLSCVWKLIYSSLVYRRGRIELRGLYLSKPAERLLSGIYNIFGFFSLVEGDISPFVIDMSL